MSQPNQSQPPASPKSEFYCPISPHIAWHWGLRYQQCPVDMQERSMGACESCILRGEGHRKAIDKKKKKDISKPERRAKEPIPEIKTTYTSK